MELINRFIFSFFTELGPEFIQVSSDTIKVSVVFLYKNHRFYIVCVGNYYVFQVLKQNSDISFRSYIF